MLATASTTSTTTTATTTKKMCSCKNFMHLQVKVFAMCSLNIEIPNCNSNTVSFKPVCDDRICNKLLGLPTVPDWNQPDASCVPDSHETVKELSVSA